MRDEMMGEEPAEGLGIYLYCFAGPEAVRVVTDPPGGRLKGVDDRHGLSVLESGDVAAVIGLTDLGAFTEAHLRSWAWLAPQALRHEGVVETVMGATPVLPVKFGTLFTSLAGVRALLATHREAIRERLQAFRDKDEWSVKGFLDEAVAGPWARAAIPAVRAAAAALPAAPGARYLHQRRLDALVAAEVDAWLAGTADALRDCLAAHAAETAELPLRPPEVTGRPERMVFNGSFLVARAALPAFRAAVQARARAWAETGLSLELRGPWPPYNFCPDLTTVGAER